MGMLSTCFGFRGQCVVLLMYVKNFSFCWEHHEQLFSHYLNYICVELLIDQMPIQYIIVDT